MALTIIECKNALPAPKAYKKADSQGLYLLVNPNGSKYWRWKYRNHGREYHLALGVFPEISLADARLHRDQGRQMLREGINPSVDRRNKKVEGVTNATNTFKAVALEWHSKREGNKRHEANLLSRLQNDLFPMIGHIPVRELTAGDVAKAVVKIEERGAGELARRALQMCGQILRYAVQHGKAERNFTPDLKGLLKKRQGGHYATIEIDSLPEFLLKVRENDQRLYKQTKLAMRLLLLTFVRTSELIEAKWTEIDLDNAMWIIPAERMKMRRPHKVPLSLQACALFREMKPISGHRDYVFPSITRPSKPISNATILRAISRLGYKNVMTGHGFRALAMSGIKEKLNYNHEEIDRQLAHLPKNKIDQAYDRGQYLEKRIKMMQDWSNYIDLLEAWQKS